MIKAISKYDPNQVVKYETFEHFHDTVKAWYMPDADPGSAMEIILQYYNLYIDGVQYEA